MITLVNEYQVVLDTCVLAPMPLCDTLLRLAEEPGMFLPRWSHGIFAELARVLNKFGLTEAQIHRRITTMRDHFGEAEITGYEGLIPSMKNHEKDRHVLAAAVRGGAHAILTFNASDFPDEAIRPYGIVILTPDEFLVHQYHLDSYVVLNNLRAQAERLPDGFPGLLNRLSQAAPGFVELIRDEAAPRAQVATSEPPR
jgi:predicted nucleic acid-binding protein